MIFAFNCALNESMLSVYQGQIMADLKRQTNCGQTGDVQTGN